MINRVTKTAIIIWFSCAFFYSLEYFIRSSTGGLYSDFIAPPYNLSPSSISLFSSAFYWAYVICQLPAGMIVDRFGVKRVMVVSSFIFSIAILIAANTTQEYTLILYRVLAGFGGGFAFLCTFKTIAIWLPKKLFPMFTGLTQLLLYIGAMISAAPLVILSQSFSIKEIMMGVFIVSICLFLISTFVIRIHPDYEKENKNSDASANSIQNLKEVLANKQIWLNGFYCFTIYGTTVLFADLWGIRYLNLAGFSEVNAGWCTSFIFIGVAIFSPIWGVIATVFSGERKFLIIAPIFGVFVVTYLLYFNTNLYVAMILCVLFGGIQAVHVLNYSALRNTVKVTQIATGLALVNLFLPLSGGILQPITGAIIDHLQNTHTPLYSFQVTLVIVPILMILSLVVALFINDKSK